jgi:hypothetical protein
VFDVAKLTYEEVSAEYTRTLDKLERLGKLLEAIQAQEQRRIEKLVLEYNRAKQEAKAEKAKVNPEDSPFRVPEGSSAT